MFLAAAVVALLAAFLVSFGPVGPPAAYAGAKGCKGANAKPGKASQGKIKRATTCLIRQKRKQNGAGSINSHSKLARAAIGHTRRMTKTGCFSHQCSGEASTGERIRRTGYFRGAKSWSYGEIIGWGKGKRGTPRRMVNAWMGSSSHRSTILNGKFNHLGVGYQSKKPGGGGGGGTYTIDFGHRSG
ncbi:hypothetical protein HJD18_16065 [Thermoleophilia bacterium SCSIO 60948]|nr:hypothetical protein HJD18_16065 [Thermoleophilia bacterium SCSIO 60948]